METRFLVSAGSFECAKRMPMESKLCKHPYVFPFIALRDVDMK